MSNEVTASPGGISGWFNDLKIAKKLSFGFGFCLFLATIVGTVACVQMARLNAVISSVVNDTNVSSLYVSKLNDSLHQARIDEFQFVNAKSPLERSDLKNGINAQIANSTQTLNEYLNGGEADGNEKTYLDQESAAWQTYVSDDSKLRDLAADSQKAAAIDLLVGKMKDDFSDVQNANDQLMTYNSDQSKAAAIGSANTFHSGLALVVVFLAGALLAGALIARHISKAITEPLDCVIGRLNALKARCLTGLLTCIQAMENGDFTATAVPTTKPITVHSDDELGTLSSTFNQMLEMMVSTINSFTASQATLSNLVRRLKTTASEVGKSSQTVTDSAQSLEATSTEISASMSQVRTSCAYLAEGTGQVADVNVAQAGSLSQSMNLIDRLTTVVKNVASNAVTAGDAAQKAMLVAQDGGKSVGNTLNGMMQIRSSVQGVAVTITDLGKTANEIGSIVETIGSISEQTNLLALNAAIEAARAGEAGRGFSVVADEVRKLAERAAGANSDIADLIKAIQTQTAQAVSAMEAGTREADAGAKMAETAGESLRQIEEVVQIVAQRVDDICGATSEMTTAADEVSQTITQVAAVVEETSASATEMSGATREVTLSIETVAQTVAEQQRATSDLATTSNTLSGIVVDLESTIAQFHIQEAGQTITLQMAQESNKPSLKAA